MTDMNSNTFTGRLKQAMFKAGFKQTDLAREIDTSQATVSRWFTGSVPSRLMQPKLAVALKVSTDWLIHGIGESTDEPSNNKASSEGITEDAEWHGKMLASIKPFDDGTLAKLITNHYYARLEFWTGFLRAQSQVKGEL